MSLSLLALSLSGSPAFAEEAPPPAVDDVTAWLMERAAEGARKGRKGGKASKKGPHWKKDVFLEPGAGVRVYSNNGDTTTLATVGGEAGVTYAYVGAGLPRWSGRTRVGAELQADGDGGAGSDVRVGTFIGPQWKMVGAETGLDLFRNQWSLGDQELASSVGAEVPALVRFHNKSIGGYAGVSSSWLAEEQRRVDWSKQPVPGFGHEFAYLAGLSGRISGVDVGLSAEYRITAAGPVSSVMLGARVDGATLQDVVDMARGAGKEDSGTEDDAPKKK